MSDELVFTSQPSNPEQEELERLARYKQFEELGEVEVDRRFHLGD